ncbi:MAG: hypothetical protein M3325_11055, partial [Actinomycetota bacterium]|nr:hypothetical protein [Actinomycetota bacterium]
MIATKFTIELDIGLSFLLQAALPQLVTDRDTKTHRRGESKRWYGHCRRRTEIPEAEPRPDTSLWIRPGAWLTCEVSDTWYGKIFSEGRLFIAPDYARYVGYACCSTNTQGPL